MFWSVLQYIGPDCELEVNLDARSKAALIAAVASGHTEPSLFDKVASVLEKEMAGDMLPRFIASPFWRAVVEPLRKSSGDGVGNGRKRSASEERTQGRLSLLRVRVYFAFRLWAQGVVFVGSSCLLKICLRKESRS